MNKNFAKIAYALLFTTISIFAFSSAQAFELQWFGQSAYKITTPGGKVILIDPFITKNPKPRTFGQECRHHHQRWHQRT